MYPKLLNIYGPLWIHSYGTMIAIGFLIFLFFTYNHPRRQKLLSGEQYLNTLFLGLIVGVLGGRTLFVLTEWEYFLYNPIEMLLPWEGGFTVLGSILGILLVIPLYLHKHRIAIFPLFDLTALFAPLLQAIARLGCLFAGCCYGVLAPNTPWAITFTNADGMVPSYLLGLPIHPTQLYHSITSFFIFLLVYFVLQHITTRPGQITLIYLILESIGRFTIDFWRGDRGHIMEFTLIKNIKLFLSITQLYSLVFFVMCLVGLCLISFRITPQPTKKY